MDIFGGIVTFIVIWWTILFGVLPWGIRHPSVQDKGAMPGAPLKPDFKKIILRTTIISVVLWLIAFALAETNLISFSRMAESLN
jgi:predicted secreted protein